MVQKRVRQYREPSRPGEPDKSAWGFCCRCENSGEIMSWLRCRICLHNRCEYCDYSASKMITDSDRPNGSNPLERINDLSGETQLEPEALGSDETVLESDVAKGWEILRSMNTRDRGQNAQVQRPTLMSQLNLLQNLVTVPDIKD
ncbi:hypothetical protein Z517_01413 [Fonsecaea pedrosoi CBS 271.37]|uniref:Uncharacterized protein n=1 Tax=Fonsecaea pedrosoi CBS 271.37 TaxID=1442368 RepID=A0A0D2HNM0_9EURO|nr:uncharacterized protein Z517_01413 [Fonsecaea pedrosoi CBS 271.37]KIW86019.1 hypothetical protein Z517_01413 [Fonsecaea pedrosoi CBS 271.37]